MPNVVEFPTSVYSSTTGPLKVSSKHYSIDGNIINADDDAAFDVNVGTDVTIASRGCKSSHDSIGGGQQHGQDNNETKQKNPHQTFLRR